MDTTYLVTLVIGVILVLLSIPLISGKVKKNQWYGFRTKKTLSDDTIWYKANKFSGWFLLLSGLVILVASFMLYSKDPALFQHYVGVVILTPIVLSVLFSFTYLKKL